MDLAKLREVLVNSFNLDELRTLCFDLNIEYENLSANTREGVARELVAYCARYNLIDELKSQCQELRPYVRWILPADLSGRGVEPPFKGLEYYDVDDTHLFFGRETLVAKLKNQLIKPTVEQLAHFLAVVGASGSGKSSLVRAGIIPRIQRNTNWLVHLITPRTHPLIELANALTRREASVAAAATLADDMRQDARSLYLYSQRILEASKRLLLVVDQFEELFTQCKDRKERKAFVDNLLNAVTLDARGSVSLIIALRADFYHYCAEYDALRDMLAKQQEYIGTMNREQLRRAIAEPGKRNGLRYEAGLIDVILRDVGNEPGALPLLSHALHETWKRRQGNLLTHVAYQASGGVRGAIAQTAQMTFEQLTEPQQLVARNIFLRLTELGEGTEDTRRRVGWEEIIPKSEESAVVERVLQILADARLITTNESGIEVAHEALIREWPVLRQWLDEDREALRIHRHLTATVQEWLALNRDPGELYRGARLMRALEWSEFHFEELSEPEWEFLKTSETTHEKNRAIQSTVNQSKAIRDMASVLRATLSFERVVEEALDVCSLAIEEMGVPRHSFAGAVFLFDGNELIPVVTSRFSQMDIDKQLQGKQGIVGAALTKAETVTTDNPRQDPELRSFAAFQNCLTAACIPLRAGFQMFGAIVIGSDTAVKFDKEHYDLFNAVADLAVIALQNAQLYQKLEAEKQRIIEADEIAHKQLARDLHDGPTQTIAAIAMRINFIRSLLTRDPEQALSELEKVEELAKQTSKEIRGMLFTLRPLVLKTQGLGPAVETVIGRIQETDGLNMRLVGGEHGELLNEQAQSVVFSIVEEALGNARKYSQANLIQVRFWREDNLFVAMVQDDGVGFDTQEVNQDYSSRGSLGMVNMRERAERIDGSLRLESVPGHGTTVTLVVPLDKHGRHVSAV